MAPCTSPSSMALEVPITWEEVPQATPTATGWVMPMSLHTGWAVMLPMMPVRTMAATEIEVRPPA